MEFFIDTGMIDEIEKAAKWGFIDGVTTNPSLIAKTGRTQEDVIKDICKIIHDNGGKVYLDGAHLNAHLDIRTVI